MTKWSDRTSYQGRPVNQGTLAILKAANTILQNSPYYGKETSNITMVQGSYNRGGVSASAGTHDGGGAFDITAYNRANRVKVLRLLGMAIWYRPTLRGVWSAHVHGIVCGDGTASSGAKAQVSEYYKGGDGLRGSAKDPDWRPGALPILFVAPWDARGKPGTYYSVGTHGMRTEPRSASKTRGTIKDGDKFTVVAVVNCKGILWGVNTQGNFMPMKMLTTKKPSAPTPTPKPTPTKPEFHPRVDKYKVVKGPAYERVTYGISGVEKASGHSPHQVGTILDAKGWVKTDEGMFFQLNNGHWVAGSSLNLYVEPAPLPEPSKTLTFHLGTINVIRWRLNEKNERGVADFKKGKNYYPDRVKGIAKMQDVLGVSVLTTCESGQYADANRLTDALGSKTWKNVLHGDDAGDITEAVHWHTKRKLLEEGKYTTGDARESGYHNTATWTLLQDQTGSNVIFLAVAHHAYYKAAGKTSASAADKIREKHTKVLISEAEKIAKAAATKYKVKSVPIIFSGDFNQDKDDFYDGPGKAMIAAGYVDAETIADSKTGPETTYNGLDSKKTTGRRIDRIFVKKGTKVNSMVTAPGYPNTDHNGVGIGLTISNA